MFGAIKGPSYQRVAGDEASLHDEPLSSPSSSRPSLETVRADDFAEKSSFPTQKITFLTLTLFVANITLLCGSFGVAVATFVQNSRLLKRCPNIPPSPANGKIQFETISVDAAGAPTQSELEADIPWENLLVGEVFRSSREELEELGVWYDDAVKLEDGGYMAGTGTMHILHCLEGIQNDFAPKYMNVTVHEIPEHDMNHFDHCLANMRLQAQCRPDLSIGAWYWDSDDSPPFIRKPKTRRCAKWDSVKEWLEPRLINYTDGVPEGAVSPMGLVRHGLGLDQAERSSR